MIYIVLGSGGHTAEMCEILQSLCNAPNSYFKRFKLLIASTDKTSRQKITDCMAEQLFSLSEEYFINIPRSRTVGQSWFTTIFTSIWAMSVSLWLVYRDKPSVILCNGPGTCVPFCLSGYFLRLLGFLPRQSKIIFVESICRVKSLSLSGKILQPFVDSVVVQWEAIAIKYKSKSNVNYFGRLM